jgi:hypothetical protein
MKMKQLLLGLMCFLAFSAQAQKNEPSEDFIKKHAFYLSKADQKSLSLPDASPWVKDWQTWDDQNINTVDLSYLIANVQPTEQFQHFRISNSPYVLNVHTQSYIQRLYQRSILKKK